MRRLLLSENHPITMALAEDPMKRILEQVEEDDEESSNNIAGAVLSNFFLFFLIFGLSATVNVKNLKRQLTNKFAIGCGVLMQFIIMPLMGFLSVVIMDKATSSFTQSMGIALLVVTSSPGGSYSNWWCSLFNADLALSVAMTTVSSILSIGMLPANLFLYTYLAYGVISSDSEDSDSDETSVLEALDFSTLFVSLGVVLGAIATGLVAGYRYDSPQFHILANRFGSVCGLLLIIFSVFLSSGGEGSDATFWNLEWSFYVAVAFPCLLGLMLANLISRSVNLSPPETVAIAIECCYQNTGIATSVAITMFDDPTERAQAVAVPLFYGVVEAFAIGIYCVMAWKLGWTKAPPDEHFCVMLGKTYEVEEHDASTDAAAQDQSKHDGHGGPHHKDNDEDPEEGSLSNFDQEFAAGATTTASAPHRSGAHDHFDGDVSAASLVVEQGFWGNLFPPILRRVHSSISQALGGSSHHGQDDVGMGMYSNRPRASSTNSRDSFLGSNRPRAESTNSRDSFFGCTSTTDNNVKSGGGGKNLQLPEQDDDNRPRFVSADYTAETSLCSHMSSPASPPPMIASGGGAHATPVIFNIQTLTIPETDNRSGSESVDEMMVNTTSSGDNNDDDSTWEPEEHSA